MASPLAVHCMHSLKHLSEIETANFWAEGPECNVVKNFTARYKFKYNIMNLRNSSTIHYHIRIFFEFKKTYNILMLQILVNVDFVMEILKT